MTSDALASIQSGRLLELERVIEKGKAAFVEVGLALLEIKDGKLYRASHSSFDAYCRERWQFKLSYAGHLMRAAEDVGKLGTSSTNYPKTETQLRALAPLRSDPNQMSEAWQEAQDRASATGRPVTEAIVREVVQERVAPPEPEIVEPEPMLVPDPRLLAQVALAALAAYDSGYTLLEIQQAIAEAIGSGQS